MGREALTEDDPQTVGPYWLAARLGVGGQGIVYEGYDEAGARCAVKVLRAEAAAQSYPRQRFAKEATAAARVASFCTAKVLDSDPEAEPPYMVSEFVNGPDLGAAVGASGPMEGDALLRLVTGVATALTAIHGAGVVHRDLKPPNVLLGPDGPRVIDFGIARTHDMPLTATSTMMGTPAYMAPEVLKGARADGRADVFAWGAVALFAATGHGPFDGDTLGEIVIRVTEHEPDLDPLPAQLRPLVQAALSKDPGERPSSIDLLLGLLRANASAPAPERAEAPELLLAGARSAAEVRAPAGHPEAVPELGALAESAYDQLDPTGRAFAQEALLRLVVPGEAQDGSQDTVRTAARDELMLGRPLDERPGAQTALDALVTAGVLLSEGHAVRPAGAGLLRAWPRLHGWVDEHRAALRVLHRTRAAARAWERGGRDQEDLPRGDALRSALDWAKYARAAARPNLLEREYLDAGRAALARTVRRRRRLRGGIAVLVAVALTAGTVAWQLQRNNTEQQAEAASRDVATAAESMRSSDPKTAKLLSVAAWRLSPTREARAALYGTAWQAESDIFSDPSPGLFTSSLSDDGSTLVSFSGEEPGAGGSGGRTYRWDLRTGKALPTSKRLPGIPSGLQDGTPVISPNGRYAAYSSLQNPAGATVRELRTGRKLTEQAPGMPLALSEDGRYSLGSTGEELHVYDTRKRTTVLRAPFGDGPTAFSDDGSVLALCDENQAPVLYWPQSGRKRSVKGGERCDMDLGPAGDPGNLISLDLSPDGKRLLQDGTDLMQWDTATGRVLAGGRAQGPYGSGDRVPRSDARAHMVDENQDSTFYGSDGRSLLHAFDDAVFVTDPSTPDRSLLRATVSGALKGAAFDSAHRQLRTLGSKVRSFQLPSRLRGPSLQGIFSPDARTLLSGEEVTETDDTEDIRSRAWDVRRKRHRAQPTPHEQPPTNSTHYAPWRDRSVAFRPDGREMSYYGDERVVRQDVRTGKVTRLPKSPSSRGEVASLAYGPGGRVLAVGRTGPKAGSVEIWREGRDKPRVLQGVGGTAGIAVGGSAGHEVLVTSSGQFVDLRSGERRRGVFGQTGVEDVEFSPDGKTLAVSQEDGWISLWNGDATRRLGGMLSDATEREEGQDSVDGLRFSPDGRTLAARIGEERFQMFDVPDRKPLGAAHPGLGSTLMDLGFDGSGKLRASAQNVRLATVDLDPGRLARSICDSTGTGLTRAQWKQNVPDIPYRDVCD